MQDDSNVSIYLVTYLTDGHHAMQILDVYESLEDAKQRIESEYEQRGMRFSGEWEDNEHGWFLLDRPWSPTDGNADAYSPYAISRRSIVRAKSTSQRRA